MLMVLFVLGLLLALYCLVDLLPRNDEEVAGLPKVGWVVVILVFQVVGPLAYLLAGRAAGSARTPMPLGGRGGRSAAPRRPVARGPEDDEEFQAQLRRRVAEQRRKAEEQRRKGEQT
jgi:hypothetical protein